jgi:succinyl-CoA synthetase alpha subunit
MSVIIDSATRVLVQGITGKESRFWTGHMIDYGTNVVAGVTPGKEGTGGRRSARLHSVRRAVEEFPWTPPFSSYRRVSP